jgi:hypothetical protein
VLPAGQAGTVTATYTPLTATMPVTLAWDNDTTGPTALYSWTVPGLYTVTVTATNPCGRARGELAVSVPAECRPVQQADVAGPAIRYVGQEGLYTATYSPPDATAPVDLAWDNGRTGPTAWYSWTTVGSFTITVTVTNACGQARGNRAVQVQAIPAWRIYLPLVSRR